MRYYPIHQLVQWHHIMHKYLWIQSAVRGNVPRVLCLEGLSPFPDAMTQRQCQCLRFIFSAGVNHIFIYSDLCRQIQPPLLMRVFSLSSMELSS